MHLFSEPCSSCPLYRLKMDGCFYWVVYCSTFYRVLWFLQGFVVVSITIEGL